MVFVSNFIWGAAAASYQIEGAAAEDGKGMSVWDMMCRKPNAIFEGQRGDVACDHYHRYTEDVALMKEIGLKGYRMSLSWPRILSDGIGAVNKAGLDFYDRLIDELLAQGVEPFVTLFHWDFPYALYCKGGWLNPDSPDWFAHYTQVVAEKLSDRVKYWMTLNEPQCFIGGGHLSGHHAPGDKLNLPEVLRAAHHVLLAHGKAVITLRNAAKQPLKIGYAPVGVVKVPNDETSQRDIDAARQEMFSVPDQGLWNNTWWMDPVFLGQYPEDGLEMYGQAVPEVGADDMKIICQPLDFFGANIYNGRETQMSAEDKPEPSGRPLGYQQTALGWPVVPQSLYWGPKFFYERYGKEIMITENGMANIDWIAEDGAVHDPQRIDFLSRYLKQLERAAREIPVGGYFHWSLTDNFEWTFGVSKRFGLIYVDYPTQKRILKDSAHWYRLVIQTNGTLLSTKE